MGGGASKVNDKECYIVALEEDPKTGVVEVEILVADAAVQVYEAREGSAADSVRGRRCS